MPKKCSKCKQWKDISEFGKGSCKDGLSGWCKACNKKYQKEKRQAKKYSDQDRDNWRLKKKEQRQNPDFIQAEREASKKRQELLTQVERELKKEKQRIHDKKYCERRRYRRKNDPDYRAREKNKEYQRRALTKDGFTPDEWNELCQRYGNICLCCKESKPLTVDHVIPLARGGANTIDNLQPLCLSCNSRKRAETMDYRW